MRGAGRSRITQDFVAWVKGFGLFPQGREAPKVLSKGVMACLSFRKTLLGRQGKRRLTGVRHGSMETCREEAGDGATLGV